MAGSHPLLHWRHWALLAPIVSGSLACGLWHTENATCFGVSFCRLLYLGEGGGLLRPVCPWPAGWLSRLGLYILGCLQSMGPYVQYIFLGNTCWEIFHP